MISKLKKADIGIACILACIYFLALPLTITINSSGNSFLKIITLPIAGYFAVSIFFYRKELELNIIHLCSFLYLITVIITLFADRSALSVQYVRGYIETFALMYLITIRKYTANEIEAFEITQLLLLGIMISLGLVGADWYGDRNTMTIFGATCDPNYFVGFFLLPTAVAFKKMRENVVYMIICPILILLGSYIVLSSGSRGGLIAMIIVIISFVFLNAKGFKQRLIGIIVAAAAAVIIWTVVLPILPEDVSSRFSIEKLIESGGTGRASIWVSMLSEIKQSTWELFCGRGIFVYHEMMMEGKLSHVVAHNQFIQALYNQGIFGLITFVLMSFAAVFRNMKKRGYISAAMLGVLTLIMTLTVNPSIKSFWNLLIYSAFSFIEVKGGDSAV